LSLPGADSLTDGVLDDPPIRIVILGMWGTGVVVSSDTWHSVQTTAFQIQRDKYSLSATHSNIFTSWPLSRTS